MIIPDEAVEAATGIEIGDLNETVEAPWHLQPEEARRVLEAALPHILTHQAEALRATAETEVAQSIRVTLAMGLKTAARLLETEEETTNEHS